MNKIQVFIADDHKMMREGLSLLLNNQPDIEVVGEAFKRDAILEGLHDLTPDILLLDTTLMQPNEVRSIASLRNSAPEIRIIMLSNQSEDDCVHRALNEGARGFIVKQAASSEVADAIRLVMKGHFFLSPVVQNMVIETYIEGSRTKPRGNTKDHNIYAGFNQLSEREKEVFTLLLEGHGNREISQLLSISPKTADKHRISIFKKTGVENATQLLHYAIRLKLHTTSLESGL